MTTRTFTVTVSNPGSGNRYYIDGVLQATVDLAVQATYRFDQSDSSNTGHPLRLSATSDGTHNSGTEYTVGVTTVGTPGSSGAYTEIVVAETAPQPLYYYCSVHSGMGGQANVTSTSWGALEWSEGAWSEQGNTSLTASSLSATTSISGVTTEADAEVTASSLLATSSPGQVTEDISLDLPVTGIQATITNAGAVTNIGANLTGISMTSAITGVTIDDAFLIGEGWGRETWGSFVWGDNYSVLANGIGLTATIGNEDAFTDVTIAVSGIELQSAITPVGTTADSDNEIAHSFLLTASLGSSVIEATALVEPSGIAATSAVGDAVGGTIQEVPVSGIELTALTGNEDAIGDANVSVTGISATGSVGDIVPISGYDATGSEITTSVGSVTIIGESLVIPTGIELTASTGSPNIIAWQEVDTGTPVTWTEVDLAA